MNFLSHKKILVVFIISTVFLIGYSCKKEQEVISPGVKYDTTPYNLEFGDLPTPNIPLDNPLTEEGVQLGRMLFYEKKLSSDNSIACASCHKQENAFSDTNRFSIGVGGLRGGRQAMSAFNLLWNSNEFFWDGRAHLLRDQSLGPIENPIEMNETLANVIKKLSAIPMYRDQFFRAFNSEEITSLKMSLALEQFMHSIVSYNSKFDKSQRLEVGLTPSERRGQTLFFLEYNGPIPSASGADCVHCHSGSNFENDLYMNNGLDVDASILDSGRYDATGMLGDIGKFKVPTLRNIELTPPYMHDGRFKTLEEVVDHYNHGVKVSSTLDEGVARTIGTTLRLTTQDKADLVAFLKTLTDNELITDKRYSSPFK